VGNFPTAGDRPTRDSPERGVAGANAEAGDLGVEIQGVMVDIITEIRAASEASLMRFGEENADRYGQVV
jgi:hypothetical protein